MNAMLYKGHVCPACERKQEKHHSMRPSVPLGATVARGLGNPRKRPKPSRRRKATASTNLSCARITDIGTFSCPKTFDNEPYRRTSFPYQEA
jgi:hypothetical protein